MKLSEQLKQDHESGGFGKALNGYSERAKALEDFVHWCEIMAKANGGKYNRVVHEARIRGLAT